jgi:hypothetical protein
MTPDAMRSGVWVKQDIDERKAVGTRNAFRADETDVNQRPYSLELFELNCLAGQIRSASFANYTKAGTVINSREGGKWGSVLPESFGETLYNGACRSR